MSEDDSAKFRDEESAYEFVEQNIWPRGPICPHCGATERIGRLKGGSTRIHTYKCYHCRKPFTVKIGTIFEGSHVPMHKWLQALVLTHATQQRVRPNVVSKTLGVTFKTAAAMLARIRDATRRNGVLLLLLAAAAIAYVSIGRDLHGAEAAVIALKHKRPLSAMPAPADRATALPLVDRIDAIEFRGTAA